VANESRYSSSSSESAVDSEPIRPHVFDGNIREYDKRLPNWWLFSFWGFIIFGFSYWVWGFIFGLMPQPGATLDRTMARNQRLAEMTTAGVAILDDEAVWKMSRNPTVVSSGATTFSTTCASCHMPDLKGGIGPNLKDTEWIHGGKPLEIVNTISSGVLEKGMPTWAPILGKQKIIEVTAYILSFHKQGEPVVKVPGWTPIIPGAPVVTQSAATHAP
jgi:cytochrome c oxidase cbb3-type subunit 3